MTRLILAFTTLIFIKILKKITNFEFSIVRPDRIGHLVGEIDIFIRKRSIGSAPRNLIIVTGNPCNKEVVELFRKNTKIITSGLLYRLLHIMSRYDFAKKSLYSLHMTTREYEIYEKCPNIVSLSDYDKQRGFAMLNELYGITKKDWWVCFHSRDSNYLQVHQTQDFSYHNFRDFDIEDMLLAMEEVTKRGGYAIRFGSAPKKEIISTNKKIIDYSFNGQSEFLDLFLCSEAKFFIGNTSGPFHIPKLFNTPYAMCNLLGYGHITPLPNSLFIPKVLLNESGEKITFRECAELGMYNLETMEHFYTSNAYEKLNLSIKNNTPSEILGLTIDMFNLINGEKLSNKMKLLQHDYKDRYYFQSYDRHSAGNIAPSFIELNSELFEN